MHPSPHAPPPRHTRVAAQHLKAILDALQSNLSPPRDGTDRINYDDFCVVREKVKEVTPLADEFFTATAFLKVCVLGCVCACVLWCVSVCLCLSVCLCVCAV